jgi:flagellar basal body rod protein FlgF
MPDRDLHRWQPGDAVRATWLDAESVETMRQGRVSVARGLALQDGPTGVHFALEGGERFVATVGTGDGSGGYAWTSAIRIGGAWATGDDSDVTAGEPIVERNGKTDVPAGKRVEVARDAGGELMFTAGDCP